MLGPAAMPWVGSVPDTVPEEVTDGATAAYAAIESHGAAVADAIASGTVAAAGNVASGIAAGTAAAVVIGTGSVVAADGVSMAAVRSYS